MRTQITSVAAAVALLFAEGIDARKLLVNNSERKVGDPIVGDCDNVCLFKDVDELNFWCFDFSTPNAKAGWQWDQDNNTESDSTPIKHLRMDLIGYLQLYFKFVSNLKIDHLYKNEFTFDIPSFKGQLFVSGIFTEEAKYCPGFGATLDTIDLKLSMIHNMQNCKKTLLKNFWSVEGVWTGTSAQLFEDCEWSQDNAADDDPEVELDFTTYELFSKVQDYMLMGTVDPQSAWYCLSLIPTTTSYVNSKHMVQESN